jgi:hypothetical protein
MSHLKNKTMKKTITLLAGLLFLGVTGMYAQADPNHLGGSPVKPANPLLYATDVIIDNNAGQNQTGANLSIAFNGWAYEVHKVVEGTMAGYNIFRSQDDGETWSYMNGNVFDSYSNVAVDLVVCGNSTADLTLFQAGIAYFPSSGNYVVYVDKYNATTGAFISEVFYESSTYQIYDIKIVSDYKFPSAGASPYSLGLLFSRYSPTTDSLIFISSPDAGSTWNNRKTVATTGMYMDKISLSIGTCALWFNGRYMAAWEQKAYGARTGQVWVSNSNPYFYSDWLPPTRLDDLAGAAENLAKNPVVGCQHNLTDNDASNLTSIVLFDRDYAGNGLDYDVIGMYNKESAGATPGAWTRLDISNTFDNDFESDITFDPDYNNFLVTYCDSTTQALPYLVQYQNLGTPSSWIWINAGYNQYANLVNPYPKVEINPVYTQVGHVWIGARPGGFGMATWDAEYSTVGIPPSGQDAVTLDLNVYPNPSNTKTTIGFNLSAASHVNITLVDTYGQVVSVIIDEDLPAGKQQVAVDVTGLSAGCYYYKINTGSKAACGKIIVAH